MCKLYIATGKLTRKQVGRVLAQANVCFRKTEQDGFGFMAAPLTGTGATRGRYLNPFTFAGYMNGLPNFLSGPCVEENALPAQTKALIVHGRTSTNAKGLDNVHPFFAKGVYLAHNGIVHWQGQGQEPSPVCDSEQFLHWFVRQDNPAEAWKQAFHNWGGFGAMGVYDQRSGLLTVARDTATLYIARRTNGLGWVFATDAGHLLQVSRAASIGLDTLPLTFPQHIVQFNGGEMVDECFWRGFSTRNWQGQYDLVARTHKSATGQQITGFAQETPCERSREAFPDYDAEAS